MSDGAAGGIGVLGSAFNPPHLGHLALAQEALWQLDLSEVVLMPTGDAPHKRIADDPGREQRLAMTRLAAADDSRFSVSTLEVDRDGPSYTYETLELLADQRADTELVFVMGADAAVGFESWRAPERVVELARIAVARRSGVSDAEVAAVMRSLGADGAGDDAGDAAVRRLLLRRARARRRREAAALPGPRVGCTLHRREGHLLVSAAEKAAKELDSGELARRLAEVADSKGATEIVVLDMRRLVSYTDYLAICTARNERQARAIVDEVKLKLKNEEGCCRAAPTARAPRAGSCSTSSTPCCTSSPRRPGSDTSSRTSGGRPRELDLPVPPRMTSEGTSTVPRMGSFQRAFLGYRRPEVDAADSGTGLPDRRAQPGGRRAQCRGGRQGPSSRSS